MQTHSEKTSERKQNMFLIEGTTNEVVKGFKEYVKEGDELIKATVFFLQENFVVTKYIPLSSRVTLILEFKDGKELHVESTNCGYIGTGPNATVEILEYFYPHLKSTFKKHIIDYQLPAYSFSFKNKEIFDISNDYIFNISTQNKGEDSRFKIIEDVNVSMDFQNRTLILYNPQRHCFRGLINLLGYLRDVRISYCLGIDEGLDVAYRITPSITKTQTPNHRDTYNTSHVCLKIASKELNIMCYVEEKYEKVFIESILLVFGILDEEIANYKVSKSLFKKKKETIWKYVEIENE